MVNHKAMSVQYPNRKLYKFIKDNGGWCHFKIILIEDYPCNRREQLLMREQFYKTGLDKDNIKEYIARYRENNKENIKETTKQYYENNKRMLQEKAKGYRKNNKDMAKEQRGEVNICICGKVYTNSNKKRHELSKRHQDFIKQQQ